MKTLVTFLGRGRDDKNTGYRNTKYKFPDGTQIETPFFGPALAKHIKANRIIILGTNSSQWGVLVENHATDGQEEEARIKLMEAETKGAINQEHLDAVTELMYSALECEIVPCLIPFGKNELEQYEILNVIAKHVETGKVEFDVTHGFRHFSMVGFLSTFMLSRVRDIEVENLWYGAGDMRENDIAQVLKLEGLDRVRQWIDALNRFDATGNYRVFGSHLKKDGVNEKYAKHLEKAAFYERTLNVSAAATEIRMFRIVLESKLSGASGLFQDRLTERLNWVDREKLSAQQAELAWRYLERRDYVRASLFGWESLFTLCCENNDLDPDNYENRGHEVLKLVQQWKLREDQKDGDNRVAAEHLNQIRNALAHGTEPRSDDVKEILIDETKLNNTLKKVFSCLLPK